MTKKQDQAVREAVTFILEMFIRDDYPEGGKGVFLEKVRVK